MAARSIVAALCLMCVLIPAAPAAAARVTSLQQLMDALGAVKQGRASFVERKYLAELTRPLVLRGTLFYQAPATLEQHITSPRDESYAIRGKVIYLKRGGVSRQFALSAYPELWAYIESLRSTLNGDIATLRHFYRVDFSVGTGGWTLHLVPRQAAMAKKVAAITIHGRGTTLATVRIEQANGDHSVMQITPEPPATARADAH